MKYTIKPDPAGNRLILLYLISRMGVGLEHDEVVRFNQECQWMLYFDLEQHLVDLCAEKLLSQQTLDDRRLFRVTAEGLGVLSLLKSRVPMEIRTAIDERIAARRATLERAVQITAEYSQDSATEFPIALKIRENLQTLLELRLSAATAADAEGVCRRFRENAETLYAGLIARLTRDEPNNEGEHDVHADL